MSKKAINQRMAYRAAVSFVELGEFIDTLKKEGTSSLIEKFEKDREHFKELGWTFMERAAEEGIEEERKKKAKLDTV
jgi:hypothetical protein